MATQAVARRESSAPIKHLWPAHPDERTARQAGLYRRRVRHDIQHQLGTLILLSSLLETSLKNSQDVGEESRVRATQLRAELTWLRQLVEIFEDEHDL
ncbi:MAG TPA: hypothetical protein VKB75_14570, partial [Jatrophihabitans sp.]|nr:hypothetical protein [Jatrophihabitans sp.]